jgi:hypothetical protein
MKNVTGFPLICLLSGLMCFACQRGGVKAANEGEYKPRPTPIEDLYGPERGMKGELIRINIPMKTVALRIENGMVQTFRLDSKTSLTGLPDEQAAVRDLMGKEGSEINVKWENQNGTKIAKNIEVTQLILAKSTHKRRATY